VRVYAYAGGNPVSNVDPSGLLLQVVGSNNYVNSIQTALGILNTTERGSEIIQALEVSPRIYVISNGDPGHINTTDGRLVNIDLSLRPKTNTECGVREAPLPVILGHELGHAFRGDLQFNLINEWDNIIQNENPINQQLGLPLRTSYYLPQ
jgi:hypothetical protein